MKILPIVFGIKHDITSSGNRLKNATTAGYRITDRTTKIYNQNCIIKGINITKSICSNLSKNVTIDDIPYITGAIGATIPFPFFFSPILLAIGFIIRFALKNASMVTDKLNLKHNNMAKTYNQ